MFESLSPLKSRFVRLVRADQASGTTPMTLGLYETTRFEREASELQVLGRVPVRLLLAS